MRTLRRDSGWGEEGPKVSVAEWKLVAQGQRLTLGQRWQQVPHSFLWYLLCPRKLQRQRSRGLNQRLTPGAATPRGWQVGEVTPSRSTSSCHSQHVHTLSSGTPLAAQHVHTLSSGTPLAAREGHIGTLKSTHACKLTPGQSDQISVRGT